MLVSRSWAGIETGARVSKIRKTVVFTANTVVQAPRSHKQDKYGWIIPSKRGRILWRREVKVRRESLVFVSHDQADTVSTMRFGHPSEFLKELPPELVEHADEKAKQPVAPESGKGRFNLLRASLD
jgi:hypothetical protein